LKRQNIVPIVDLCHFGVPDWLGNFQKPRLSLPSSRLCPRLCAAIPMGAALYARQRDVYLRDVLARYGWWNERCRAMWRSSPRSSTSVKANVLSMCAILESRPDAIFVQSESSEYFHAENPPAIKPAELLNSMRFLSLDLNYGRRVDSEMYEFLLDNGMTREEYHFFLNNRLKQHCISETTIMPPTNIAWRPTARPACRARCSAMPRSRGISQPLFAAVMHTETNLVQGPLGTEAVDWLWKEWANVLRVRNDGVPIVGSPGIR
jgi:hypothetical protein